MDRGGGKIERLMEDRERRWWHNYKPCEDGRKYTEGMAQSMTNEKRDPSASTCVKVGGRKGQDGGVGHQVQVEDKVPEGHH